MPKRGRGGPPRPQTSAHFATRPRSTRDCTSAFTQLAKACGIRFLNTGQGNRSTPYRRSVDGPLYSLRRRSCKPTLSREYDTSVPRSEWPCRIMSCQSSTCRRTKPGTVPSQPPHPTPVHPTAYFAAVSAWHLGRRLPLAAGSAPERTHSRLTAPRGAAGR